MTEPDFPLERSGAEFRDWENQGARQEFTIERSKFAEFLRGAQES